MGSIPRVDSSPLFVENTIGQDFGSEMTQRMEDDPGKPRPDRRGVRILHDPLRNKGTAFTDEEREALGLRGLLPPRVSTQAEQVVRALENFRCKTSSVEKYIFLCALQDRNERLFYRVVLENLEEMVPVIYTPTVGEACRQFAHIFRRPRGLYVSANDRGRVRELLENWYTREVDVIVVTDGQRILGLGDLGANGMGIPIGKLSLYTVCAGIDPSRCLPVMLDVGTDNPQLLEDPLYLGLPQPRLARADYDALVAEFIDAAQDAFPSALIQFEDFGRTNALRLLETYRDEVFCFNDDIQGTGAVAVAGLMAARRVTGRSLRDERLLFVGAGSAATGIAELLVYLLENAGLTESEARDRCWMLDSRGLVVSSREDLEPHKRPYAKDHPFAKDTLEAVRSVRPTAVIGVSGQDGLFSSEVLRSTAEYNEHPIIFALSNPTSKAECTAEDAYRGTGGRALFASGSPFAPVEFGGRKFVPGQGNNAFIFPGVGLGVICSRARRVTDSMFGAAARTLANEVTESDISAGCLYPSISRIRDVSLSIALCVAETAYAEGLAGAPRPDDLLDHIRGRMFDPRYEAAKPPESPG